MSGQGREGGGEGRKEGGRGEEIKRGRQAGRQGGREGGREGERKEERKAGRQGGEKQIRVEGERCTEEREKGSGWRSHGTHFLERP